MPILRGGEELHREAMLHQRLSAAEGEAARHDLQSRDGTCAALGGSRDGDGMPLLMVQVSGLWQ